MTRRFGSVNSPRVMGLNRSTVVIEAEFLIEDPPAAPARQRTPARRTNSACWLDAQLQSNSCRGVGQRALFKTSAGQIPDIDRARPIAGRGCRSRSIQGLQTEV